MQQEMERKFEELSAEMEKRKKELEESRENIERLERQLAETQVNRKVHRSLTSVHKFGEF